MATLAEIGRAAGVSAATASAVLNPSRQTTRVSPLVATRIRSLAESMGYTPNYAARALRSGHSKAIAVTIATTVPVLEATYHSTLLSGLEAVIRLAGSEVVLVGPHKDDATMGASAFERTRAGLRAKRFNAAVVLCGPVDELDQPGSRVVAIERNATHLPVVNWDEDLALNLVVQHLAELGHRKLLWLGPDIVPCQGPYRGVRCAQAARARGMTVEDLILANSPEVLATFRAGLLARLVRQREWTAVVCYNDVTAIAAQQALQDAGLRIPQDVSVVGLDDIEARLASPALTSVSHCLREMGRRAGELALELAAGSTLVERLHVVSPELVVRASTGPAPR